jgi:hypothetical protein
VLNAERDWLHVGAPAVYAAEMSLKRVYVGDPAALAAEAETLEAVVRWVCRRHPDRFHADHKVKFTGLA